MIAAMDLRKNTRELHALIKELKAKQKLYPCHRVMRTRNKGKDVYYKVEYRRKSRIRKVIKYGSADFWNILKGLAIDAKREIAEKDAKLIADLRRGYIPLPVVLKSGRSLN